MRALVHTKFGEPADVMHQAERPDPVPGRGEVRIRVAVSPIHNHDLSTIRGTYGYKPDLPAIGGTEASGVVESVGEDVDPALIGRRVAAASIYETWAELVVAPAKGLIPVPDEMTDEVAAQLVSMPISAVMLMEVLNVSEGDWMIQNAAGGAVGRIVSQLAKGRGVNCISLVRRPEGVAELAEAGIEHAVATSEPDWKDKVRKITAGAAIRAAADSVGGTASGDLVDLLGENGLLVTFGSMTGEPMVISGGPVIFKQITIRGFWAKIVSAEMDPARRNALIADVIQRITAGEIALPVGSVFGLDQGPEAMRASLTPGRVGKVLLRP